MFYRLPLAFALAYLALMVPTYLLPYLGSNSSLVNTASAAMGRGLTILWYAHAWCLALLVVLSWARGRWTARPYLPVFAILAAIFDMTPGLSLIPLVPTVMHLLAVVLGVMGKPQEDVTLGRAPLYATVVITVLAGIGMAAFVRPAASPAKPAPPTEAAKLPPTPAAATPDPRRPADIPPPSAAPSPVPVARPAPVQAQEKAKTERPSTTPRKPSPSPGAPVTKDTGTTTRYITIND